MCTSDPFPTFGADIPVDGSILRPFGVPEMIKSCMNLCPKKGPVFFSPIPKGTFWIPKGVPTELLGVLGRPGMLLECFWSTLGDFWTLLLDLGSQIGVPEWSPNR